jgi:hypothetical protein
MKPFSVFLLLAFGAACTEIGPTIVPLEDSGTPSAPIVQRVFVEEFSGVRCVNCPAGSAEIAQLEARYPGRLVVTSIHAGFFSNPYAENRYDFRTPEGNNLLNLLGQPLGYPSAVINRRKFEGEADLQLSRAQWAGFIAEELGKTPQLDLQMVVNYDSSRRELRADVDVLRLVPGLNTEGLRLSVFMTESNIADVQLGPDGKNPEYPHQHVLRRALTPYDGSPIGEDLNSRSPVRRSYTLLLPSNWNASNCRIIAVAHRSGSSWDVLQAIEKRL